MKKQIFTIVICAYNSELYLDKTIESILRLEKLDELVKEIKIVDNNSKDNTKNIIKQYAHQSNLIKYEFEGKQGLSFARFHACTAETEWVIFVDDDNVLSKNWLLELSKDINKENIGIMNGVVIPDVENITLDEQSMLNVIYRDLACTHLSLEDVKPEFVSKYAFGAGMTVKTCILKNLAVEGWLNLQGRTGENLSSGEDGEIFRYALSQGYIYSFNTQCYIKHIIPKSRLTMEYMKKLTRGLVIGSYELNKEEKYHTIKRYLRLAKYLSKYYLSLMLNKTMQNTIIKERNKVVLETYKNCLRNK